MRSLSHASGIPGVLAWELGLQWWSWVIQACQAQGRAPSIFLRWLSNAGRVPCVWGQGLGPPTWSELAQACGATGQACGGGLRWLSCNGGIPDVLGRGVDHWSDPRWPRCARLRDGPVVVFQCNSIMPGLPGVPGWSVALQWLSNVNQACWASD